VKVYEIILKPLSGFGTPLKGDTLFGHFCWQIAYDGSLCNIPMKEAIKMYPERPFSVFSSAYPRLKTTSAWFYALRTPALPLEMLFTMPDEKVEMLKKRKDYKAKRWMLVEKGKRINSFRDAQFVNDHELFERFIANASMKTRKALRQSGASRFAFNFTQSHNTINRITGTTGEGGFAPFAVGQVVFAPESELVVFAGIDEEMISTKQLSLAFERIGATGFGKDASTGLGRFKIGTVEEIDLESMGNATPNACYTLAPCVPQKNCFNEVFFLPFTRFGRHGDVFAKSENPFKAPMLMADEAAVFKPKKSDVFKKPYIGMPVSGISKTEPGTIAQGYSLYVPVKMEA